MGAESQIRMAAQCCLDAHKWLRKEYGDELPTGSYAEIPSLNRNTENKVFSALYPVSIDCTQSLPTLPNCQFIFLAISVTLLSKTVGYIAKLKKKEKQARQADLALGFPERVLLTPIKYLLEETHCKTKVSLPWEDPADEIQWDFSTLRASLVAVTYSGIVKTLCSNTNGPAKLPSKQHMKSRCLFLHKHFCPFYFSPSAIPHPHSGWVNFGHLPHFQRTTISPCATTNFEDVFPQAMDQITLPLFAYSLFSTLKHFIPNYPARLSVRETYITVQRKLKKVIFLSVSGARALEYSSFYSGTSLVEKTPSAHTASIHDGVVIYERKTKDAAVRTISEGQLPKFLIQDACSLFINTDLPAHDGKISVLIPEHAPKLTDQSPISSMIHSFIAWIEEDYLDQLKKAARNCAKAIYKKFKRKYIGAAGGLLNEKDIPSQDSFMSQSCRNLFFSYDLMVKDLVKEFEELDERLLPFRRQPAAKSSASSTAANKMKIPPQITRILKGKPHKHLRIASIAMQTPTRAASRYAEFYTEGKDLYNNYQKRVSIRIVNYEDALKRLTDGQKVDPQAAKNSAYLLAALLSYCEFLGQSDQQKAEDFRQRSIQTICNLCAKGPADFTVEKAARLFCKYISGLIIEGNVIPLRGVPQGQPVRGWYDGKKKLLCLPYATYFEDFATYCTQEEHLQLPYTKSSLQELVLYPKGIVQPKENGSASQYFRPDCKIKVAPTDVSSAPAKTVIKLSISALEQVHPFSAPVLSALHQMSSTPVKRRADKPKEA